MAVTLKVRATQAFTPRERVREAPRQVRVIFCVIPRQVLRFLASSPASLSTCVSLGHRAVMESEVNAGSGSI